MNAAAVAAALAERAESVCRRYLPHGRKQGRYWVAGDLDGARGRSLYVRLSGPGVPGKWTDAATAEHGDLLDLVRLRTNAPTLRAALDEARAFLALPAVPTISGDMYDATEAARRLWRRCRAIGGSHAEAYLHARGLMRCRFAALRFHPALHYREGTSVRLLPALVAAVTSGDRAILGVQRTWLLWGSRSQAMASVLSTAYQDVRVDPLDHWSCRAGTLLASVAHICERTQLLSGRSSAIVRRIGPLIPFAAGLAFRGRGPSRSRRLSARQVLGHTPPGPAPTASGRG